MKLNASNWRILIGPRFMSRRRRPMNLDVLYPPEIFGKQLALTFCSGRMLHTVSPTRLKGTTRTEIITKS